MLENSRKCNVLKKQFRQSNTRCYRCEVSPNGESSILERLSDKQKEFSIVYLPLKTVVNSLVSNPKSQNDAKEEASLFSGPSLNQRPSTWKTWLWGHGSKTIKGRYCMYSIKDMDLEMVSGQVISVLQRFYNIIRECRRELFMIEASWPRRGI